MTLRAFFPWCVCVGLLALVGCAGAPPAPDWQLNAHGAVQRATVAELEGNDRVARGEWRRATDETRRTARLDLAARVELTRCAVRQASLDVSVCEGFRVWADDAAAAERAYARYLAGQVAPEDVALLPVGHRPVAQALSQQAETVSAGRLLEAIEEPLARLVAASALFRAGKLDGSGVTVAVDTASRMGWQRPLLAWLGVQADVAERMGDAETAQLARRRMQLLTAAAATPRSQTAD